ncbi:MAG: YihA family ribosome biogenesis GTP-binding protein [Paludibacteraceae bacterium]|nr:YihA family ribosome biogenesis GTP-binding protein [Paludibacteraceae bacterium]
MYASFVISSPDVSQCPDSRLPEYAFIGRSNVGKSSLINMLCRNPHLAKTSQKPGKTLLINHFLVDGLPSADGRTKSGQWHLVDLPGYGYAQTGLAQRETLRRMIERYCLMREQLVCLFVLIDSRLKPQKIDLEFMQWLGENEVPFAIVFTKADKLGRGRLSDNIATYKQTLLETWEELPPVFCTSAETGQGRDEVLDYIGQCNLSIEQG